MPGLAIVASGMVTAVGFNAPASLAALRAGVSGIRETGWWDAASGARLRGAKVDLPQWWEGVGKLADLVAPAIDECLAGIPPTDRARVPMLIGVAAPERPGRFPNLDAELLEEVSSRLALRLHPASALLAGDQTGCVDAISVAEELLARGDTERVVIAGVDSLLHQPTLDAFIAARRLITPANSNGFLPGEAGCAVLITTAGAPDRDELRVLGTGAGIETATIASTEPFRARGLTQAVQQALGRAGVALKDVAYRLTDLSGEHYKFKEAAFVAGRLNGGERATPLALWHPAEFIGEIGAAVLPCLFAQALHAGQEGYAPGPLGLCHVGSDSGARAAVVVQFRGATQ